MNNFLHYNNKKSLLILILLLLFIILNELFGQNNKIPSWHSVNTPNYSDLKYIKFFENRGIAGYNKILIYKNNKWELLRCKFPYSIFKFFALDTNSFFITTSNRYQESELYYLSNGKWQNIALPIVNIISTMYFTDKNNGVVSGYGEIIRLKNGKWKWMSSPVNNAFNSTVIDKDSVIWVSSAGNGVFKYHTKWEKIKNTESVKKIKYEHENIYMLGSNFLGKITKNGKLNILCQDKKIASANDFFLINENYIFFAGKNGEILLQDKNSLKVFKTSVSEDLNAIWMINKNEGWAVGDNGVILHYSTKPEKNIDKNEWKGFKKTTFYKTTKIVDDEYGVVAADFNNDGFVDIFTCGLFEANHLYININGKYFIDNAQQWQVTGFNKKEELLELNLGACAADFNNDGNIDLYVSVLNGKNKYYRNFKSKYFVNYSDFGGGLGTETDRTNSVISGDVDNDGDLDIFFVNEFSTNRLYLNNGQGIFKEFTINAGLKTFSGGMGCSFADIDNDGDLDLYVTNWSKKNILYKNMFIESGKLFFKNITDIAGVGGEPYTKSNAVVFADIDNDADLDLYVTNRKTSNRLYINRGNGLFDDKTKEMLGLDSLKSYGAIVKDFNADGYKDIYVSNVGNNILYINHEGKYFTDETSKYVEEMAGYSTGCAATDFDNDGNADIYVSNFIGESSAFLQNFNKQNKSVFIEFNGIKNNKNGIGTKIFLFKHGADFNKTGLLSFNQVSGGEGYASMNQYFLPLTTIIHDTVDLRLVLPTGDTLDYKNIRAGEKIFVEDASGMEKYSLLTKKFIASVFNDPLNILKLFKILFTIIIIIFFMVRGYKRYGWKIKSIIIYSLALVFLYYFMSIYFENKNMLLYFLLPVSSVGIVLLITTLFYERFRIETVSRKEQDIIREKLSRDLHDDLASTISTIAIYLTLIKYNLNNTDKKLTELLDKTLNFTSEASAVITDLIWAIKPKAEPFNNLILRINNNFSPLFSEKGILFRARYDESADKIILDAKVKRNIYLILKESLNNILKYAEAKNVTIDVKKFYNKQYLIIKDDGKGFDYEKAINKGHGLSNMKARADEIDAELVINTVKDSGTTLTLIFKIKN